MVGTLEFNIFMTHYYEVSNFASQEDRVNSLNLIYVTNLGGISL